MTEKSNLQSAGRQSNPIASFKEILKAAFVTGWLTVVRIFAGFGRSKINALILGAVGISLFSQANYLVLFLASACSLGLVNGMMQRISYSLEHKQYEYKKDVQYTVFTSQLLLCLLIVFFSLFFIGDFAKQIFGVWDKSLNIYVKITIFSIPFAVVSSNYIEGFFFSYSRYDLYTKASIWATIAGLLLFVPAVYFWGLRGALISICINNLTLFISYLFFIRRIETLNNIFVFRFNKKIFREILPEGVINLFYTALVPLSALLIRSLILKFEGPFENGIYQICTSITALYVPFLTNPLWARFFPEMSAKGATKESISLLYNTLMFIIGASVFCILGLFVKPDWIILILSSHEFTNSVKFFPAYFLGDFFYNVLFFYSVYLLSLRKIREYFIIWSVFFILQYIFSRFLLQYYNTNGVAIAYALSGFLILLYIMKTLSSIFGKNSPKLLYSIIVSILIILLGGFLLANSYHFLLRIGIFFLWCGLIIYFWNKIVFRDSF